MQRVFERKVEKKRREVRISPSLRIYIPIAFNAMGNRAAFAAWLTNGSLPRRAENQGRRLPRARGPHSPDMKYNRRRRYDDIRARGQLKRRSQRLTAPTCQKFKFQSFPP
ncbi:hypothetical protein Hanom_Chr00s091707g01799301 [Helianthus anomalus]